MMPLLNFANTMASDISGLPVVIKNNSLCVKNSTGG